MEKESVSIDDDEFPKESLVVNDTYNFVDKTLKPRGGLSLEPYYESEKENIVKTLDNILRELELSKFITSLTFNQKLVVFLLYLEEYNVNEVATLLNVNRRTINSRAIKKWNASIYKYYDRTEEFRIKQELLTKTSYAIPKKIKWK